VNKKHNAKRLPVIFTERTPSFSFERTLSPIFSTTTTKTALSGLRVMFCRVESKGLLEAQSGRFYSPAYLAPKGWVGQVKNKELHLRRA